MKKKRRTLLTIKGRNDSNNKNANNVVVNEDVITISCADIEKDSRVDMSECEHYLSNNGNEVDPLPSSKDKENEASKAESHSKEDATLAVTEPEKQLKSVEFTNAVGEWNNAKREPILEKYFIRCCFSNEYRK